VAPESACGAVKAFGNAGGTYIGITTSPSSNDYAANVTAALVPYSEGGANRLLR
jgi:hypothetical protein